MKSVIQLYNDIKQKVQFMYQRLKLYTQEKTRGRKLIVSIPEIIAAALFKQKQHIATKRALYENLEPNCSYKTLVVNMNRCAPLAAIILSFILKNNQKNGHLIKHMDATDIPVCTNRKAKHHQTMELLSGWGKTGKGWFYGLKLHITTDLQRKLLAIKFTGGNVDDRSVCVALNKNLEGVFIGDAGYTSEKLQREFYIEHKRWLLAKPKRNMKKIATAFQSWLYGTRMLIELNFRNLKMFYGLVTSLPRSISGYLANYIYSILAYVLV